MIQLLLVDDQALICQGLQAILSLEIDLEVIGTANNGQTAIEQVAALHPDIVLMDIRMPLMDGREATRLITQRFPEVKVLVLSTFDDDSYIRDAIRAGAKGYLLKDMPSEDLAHAIRLVYRGYSQMGPGLLERLTVSEIIVNESSASETFQPELTQLTPREREVLEKLSLGMTNRDIAQELYISEGTVKTHVTHLLNRLNLKNRSQLAIHANAMKDR
jgi:DNA-binding NarL/FixJ family response regulator